MDHPPRDATGGSERRPSLAQRDALHRLVSAIREMRDLAFDTDAAPELLEAVAEAQELLNARLAAAPGGRPRWLTTPGGVPSWDVFGHSVSSGLANPIAPPASAVTTAEGITATVTFSRTFEGPPGQVHGGVIALVFDDLIALTQRNAGFVALTASLQVQYRQPVPIGQELTFRARVAGRDGRKVTMAATLHNDADELLAEATALFITVDPARLQVPMP